MTRRRVILAGLMVLLSGQPLATAASAPAVRVESATREADYTLGSIATQHLKIHLPPGFSLDASSLPAPAQNEAIELRAAHWQQEDLPQASVITLDIDWQIFVAGDSAKLMPLNPLHLAFTRDQQRLTVTVPPDRVIVSSLLPARVDAEHVRLYPDVPPPAWPLAPQLWTLAGWAGLGAAALLYLAWLAGWVQFPQEKRMPFRRAWRQMRKLKGDLATDRVQAMRLLARAMDQCVGQAVTAENLAQCLRQQPRLHAHAAALQAFYADVQTSFFAGQPVRHSMPSLIQLARSLSLLEVS